MPEIGLHNIDSPQDLKKLSVSQLESLSQELREFIIDIVAQKGGHLGASLGVVELTVALHYVFNTPKDSLIWDVGHQAYGHKILTGRRDVFHTNREYKGISGFPKQSESEYDAFGVGHSSTSVSAALGMAIASKLKGDIDTNHIAVIGDGALTGGMAFEGLNHGGSLDANLTVVLNDNCMSIDSNVGALKEHLDDIAAKKGVENQSGRNIFESLNFKYFGPVDGHNLQDLIRVFKESLDYRGPKFIHCLTKKGKGYKPAEEGNATKWHAPGLFNKLTGESLKKENKEKTPIKYQEVFGHTLLELAKMDECIVGITPAMPTGSSLDIMMKEIPDRVFDVGIAEQHAVTLSAGLASKGLIPFCNIYSTFMQRGYDQLIHDVAIQNLPVIFCLDRAGLVGADGATHHGAFDLAYLRCIPNLTIAAPMNEEELRDMMYTAQLNRSGVFVIRYPRGRGVMKNWKTPFKKLDVAQAKRLSSGEDIAILSIGHIGNEVQKAIRSLEKEGIKITHVDMRFLKPMDEKMLGNICINHDKIITVEDGCIIGGLGSAVSEFVAEESLDVKVMKLGIPDRFIQHGTQGELYKECGFDSQSIVSLVKGQLS